MAPQINTPRSNGLNVDTPLPSLRNSRNDGGDLPARGTQARLIRRAWLAASSRAGQRGVKCRRAPILFSKNGTHRKATLCLFQHPAVCNPQQFMPGAFGSQEKIRPGDRFPIIHLRGSICGGYLSQERLEAGGNRMPVWLSPVYSAIFPW